MALRRKCQSKDWRFQRNSGLSVFFLLVDSISETVRCVSNKIPNSAVRVPAIAPGHKYGSRSDPFAKFRPGTARPSYGTDGGS